MMLTFVLAELVNASLQIEQVLLPLTVGIVVGVALWDLARMCCAQEEPAKYS